MIDTFGEGLRRKHVRILAWAFVFEAVGYALLFLVDWRAAIGVALVILGRMRVAAADKFKATWGHRFSMERR